MTDEPTVEEEVSEASTSVNCRHCGHAFELGALEGPDWECPDCGNTQDSILCPTCHQVARISLLPAEVVPPAHAPTKRRAKE